MARLTWDNVAAPDFSTALAAIQGGASTLDRGLGQGVAGLKAYDQQFDDQASQALALKVASYQDPAQLQQALSTGEIWQGVDTSRLSADQIANPAKMVSTLLETATNTENLGYNKFVHTEARDAIGAQNLAAPIIGQIADLEAAGDMAGANAVRAANAGTLAKLHLADQFSARTGLNGLEAGDLSNDGSRISNRQNTWDYNTRVEDRTENRAAAGVAAAALQASGGDPESARNALIGSPGYARLSGPAQIAALDIVNGRFAGGVLAPDAMSGGGGMGATPTGPSGFTYGAPQQEVANVLRGGMSDAAAAGFLGSFHVEDGYTGNRGDGGSADGIAQWRGERRQNFIKQYGKEPRQATKAEQAKFVLWELDNPVTSRAFVNNIDGTTPTQQVAMIRAERDPAKAAALIDKYYERSDGKARGARQAAARDAMSYFDPIASRVNVQSDHAQRGNDSSASRVNPAQADTRSVAAVVRDATKPAPKDGGGEGGIFAGMDQAMLSRSIANVVESSRTRNGVLTLNPAQALEILADNRTKVARKNAGGILGFFGAQTDDPTKLAWDQAGIDRAVIKARRDGFSDTKVQQNVDASIQAGVDQAQSQLASAAAALNSARRRQVGQPRLNINVQLAAYQAAERNLALAQAAASKIEADRNTGGGSTRSEKRAPPRASQRTAPKASGIGSRVSSAIRDLFTLRTG